MFTNAPVIPDAVIESIQALAAVGVTYVTTSVPGETRAEVLANLEAFRDSILPEVRALEGTTG